MEITHKELKRVDLVTVSGRVDSNTAPDLEATFRTINDAGHFRIVVDMADLEYISSAGLRVLVTTLKNCRRYNRGDLRMCNLKPRISEVLDLAGMTPLFEIFDDTVDAVGSF